MNEEFIAKLKGMLDTMDRMNASLDSLANSFSKETVDALLLIHEADPRVHDMPILVEVETPHPSPTSESGRKEKVNLKPNKNACFHEFNVPLLEDSLIMSNSLLDDAFTHVMHIPIDSLELDTFPYHDHIFLDDVKHVPTPSLSDHTCALTHEFLDFTDDDVSSHLVVAMESKETLEFVTTAGDDVVFCDAPMDETERRVALHDEKHPKSQGASDELLLVHDGLKGSASLSQISGSSQQPGKPIEASILLHFNEGFMTMKVDDQLFTFNVYEAMQHPFERYSLLGLNFIDGLMDDWVSQHVRTLRMHGNNLVTSRLPTLDSCSLVHDNVCMIDHLDESVKLESMSHDFPMHTFHDFVDANPNHFPILCHEATIAMPYLFAYNPLHKGCLFNFMDPARLEGVLALMMEAGVQFQGDLRFYTLYTILDWRSRLRRMRADSALQGESSTLILALRSHIKGLMGRSNGDHWSSASEGQHLDSFHDSYSNSIFYDDVPSKHVYFDFPSAPLCLSWHAYNPLQKGRLFHVVGTFRMHKEYWEFIKAARELTRKLQASCDVFGKSIMKKLQIGRLHQLHGHKFLFFKDNFKPP